MRSKSTLFIMDAEDKLLKNGKLADNDDPNTHLSELKSSIQHMLQQHENLLKMGSQISDSRFNNDNVLLTGIVPPYSPNDHCGRATSALTSGSSQ